MHHPPALLKPSLMVNLSISFIVQEAKRVRTRLALGLVEMGNLEEAISVTKADRIATGEQSILDSSYKTYEVLARAGLMPELT